METQSEEIRRDPRGAGKFRPGLHRFFGEMTRMQGCSGPTHVPREKVGSRAGSFAASDPRITGIIAQCHRDATGPAHILCRCASTGSADRRTQNDGYKSGGGWPILDMAGRGYPRKHEAGASGETQGR